MHAKTISKTQEFEFHAERLVQPCCMPLTRGRGKSSSPRNTSILLFLIRFLKNHIRSKHARCSEISTAQFLFELRDRFSCLYHVKLFPLYTPPACKQKK